MKKLLIVSALGVAALVMSGCRSTVVDEWRSDLDTRLCPARFKPIYEVMKDKGIVKGEAEEEFTWWFWYTKAPDTFANQIGGPISLGKGCKDAAFYDACNKSGASILLAPRFTVHKKRGWFWFNGTTKVTVEGVPARLVGAEEVKCPPPGAKPPCCPMKRCPMAK